MSNFIRLKSDLNPQHLEDRLQYHPEVLELHLSEQDMSDPDGIERTVQELKKSVPRVYLHHPSTLHGKYLDIISDSPEIVDFYNESTRTLIEICRRVGSRTVIHANYAGTPSSEWRNTDKVQKVRQRISFFQDLGSEFLLWENSIEGIFSAQNPHWITHLVQPLQLNLCVDVSHVFISVDGNHEQTSRVLAVTKPYAQYYHVVDSMGDRHDGLPLGEGQIDWPVVKDFLVDEDFVFEIDLRDSQYADCTPMMNSAAYFCSLL